MVMNYLFFAAPMLLTASIALAQGPDELRPTTASAIGSVKPTTMRAIGTVDKRYQSYNLEMVEVMGGKWWAPYGEQTLAAGSGLASEAAAQSSIGAAPLRYQPPIDLSNSQLRKLAAALSPAYVRVSDTWANTMYFQDSNATKSGPTPAGFGAVLTGPEWKGVIDFSNALDVRLVTSFSIGRGCGIRTESGHRRRQQRSLRSRGTLGEALLRRSSSTSQIWRRSKAPPRATMRRLRSGLQSIPLVHKKERSGHEDSGPRAGR